MSDFDELLRHYNKTFPADLAGAEGFEKIPRQIRPGLASFPVCTGICDDATTLPKRGVMFIGHNSDSKREFTKRAITNRAHGEEPKMRFWRGLDQFFVAVDLPRGERFFTNVYAALEVTKIRRDTNSPFALWSHRFLRDQIELMNPRLLVVFGDDARPHIERMACPIRTEYVSHPSYWIRLISLQGRAASGDRIALEAKRINEALSEVAQLQ